MRIAIVQDRPVWLDAGATVERMLDRVQDAAADGARLVAFGESFLPAYPCWLSPTGGARFDDPVQKACYGAYLDAAVEADGPELARLEEAARDLDAALVVGFAERVRGTVYCSAVFMHPERGRGRIHRKLVPTWEERLVWGHGDGHGLVVHELDGWRVSLLNCWENWIPTARAALHAQGTELHVALWPGSVRLTEPITRFTAYEGRMYVAAAAALLDPEDIPDDFPVAEAMHRLEGPLYDGGSAVAGPDGRWVVEPVVHEATLVTADLDRRAVSRERALFDPAGHYSRPDVLGLSVDRRRPCSLHASDEG